MLTRRINDTQWRIAAKSRWKLISKDDTQLKTDIKGGIPRWKLISKGDPQVKTDIKGGYSRWKPMSKRENLGKDLYHWGWGWGRERYSDGHWYQKVDTQVSTDIKGDTQMSTDIKVYTKVSFCIKGGKVKWGLILRMVLISKGNTQMRTDIKGEITQVRTNIKGEITQVRTNIKGGGYSDGYWY